MHFCPNTSTIFTQKSKTQDLVPAVAKICALTAIILLHYMHITQAATPPAKRGKNYLASPKYVAATTCP